ncbi:MAG: hypothetical protein ACRDM1_03650 [Gaiellaceae bacterium]
MLLAGLRRLATISGAVLAATVVLSLLLGLAAGAGAERSISVGLYILGALLLVGCFVFGVRGPLRGISSTGEPTSVLGARRLRTATPEERSESTRIALLLFVLGIAIVVIGSAIDPAHRAF